MATEAARISRVEKALQDGEERFSKLEEQIEAIAVEQKAQSRQMADINETLGVLNNIARMVRAIYILGRVVAWIGGITGAVISILGLLNYLK